MIEFEHLQNGSEVSAQYINLTDDYGTRYGSKFGEHKTILAVIDGNGRKSYMKRHHANQLTQCAEWFVKNNITPGTKILVKYDPQEMVDGRHVVRLVPISMTQQAQVDIAEVESEKAADGDEAVAPQTVKASVTIPLALERQVEDFIAANLHLVEPGLRLFVDDNGRDGRQYPTDVGPIDLLCVRPNGDFLVQELKKQRVSDSVVGQLSRYLGWVMEELAGSQKVFGLILSHEKDKNLTYAVKSNPNISIRYYRIKIDFLREDEL